jgi:hypothetical protein
MTQDRDIERVLEHWLTDGVTEMPDRVYQSIFDRVERQPQVLAPRLLRRLPEMNSSFRWITAAAAVLLIAVVGFAVLGRPSDAGVGGGPATPSPSPSTAVVPSASGTPPWDDQPRCGDIGCGGPLTAGTYTSTGLQPPVTYTLTTPWINVRDMRYFFVLYPDTPANRALAARGSSSQSIVILPDPTMVVWDEGCPDERASAALELDAAGFAEDLASWDGLSVTEPIPVTLSGLSGQQIDVSLGPGWTGCLPGSAGGLPPAQTPFRFVVLDKPDGKTMMIVLVAQADFDSFVAEAMPVVESFEFDLGPAASPS